MDAIRIWTASSMLICGLSEGVLVLHKITITIDDATLARLCAMREINGVSHSAAIRLAVLSYYQDKFSVPPSEKK